LISGLKRVMRDIKKRKVTKGTNGMQLIVNGWGLIKQGLGLITSEIFRKTNK
tara:strand:+ start:610 stop:765 length:156 start_codon:yes stop_codon:yes gene_type:complete